MAYENYVVKPEQNFKGMSYGDWAAAWSNWLFSEYADRTEAQGSMLFLRGNIEGYKDAVATSFYDRTGDRCVIIPKEKAILIPVLTSMEFIGTHNQEETYDSEDMARNAAQTHNDKSGGIWALIQKFDEGKLEWEPIVGDLAKYRVTSSVHPLKISEKSAFLEKLSYEDHVGPGEYQAVTDGFFIIIKELPIGSYRLQFGGKGQQATNYRTNAIYDIHITENGRSNMLVRDITKDALKPALNANLLKRLTIKKGGDEIPPLERLPD